MQSVGTWWMWVSFFIIVLVVLAIDIFALGGKRVHSVSMRKALCWTMVWMTCAMLFDIMIWCYLSQTLSQEIANQKALEFLTGYIIEQSLSIDNLFVFIMIFSYFSVPAKYQRRVLLYGVLGAIILRFIMIYSGTWLVTEFHWILYLFGAFLIFTGIKMFFFADEEKDLNQNWLLKILRRKIRMTDKFHDEHFFIKKNLLWYATPLLLVVALVEFSDLVFALDSIPAIFAITNDPFIIYTSNIFAIMGLRALYFLLSNMAERFYLLKYGIAIVLVFVGTKMLIAPWIKLPISVTLGVVIGVLTTTVVLSMMIRPNSVR